ncbi:MAG: DUF4340 domain-containing protein [Oscillospiraceae bacterium]
MGFKDKRTILGLAGILVVAILLLGTVRSCTAKRAEKAAAAEEEETHGDTVPTASAEFDSLVVNNGSTNLTFSRDEAGAWIWSDDPAFPLDGTKLDELTTAMTTLDPMQTIENGDTLEAYGLKDPAASVIARAADGKETVLLLGKILSDGSYYLKTGDSNTVYVVSPDLHDRIAGGIYDWALLPVLPKLDEAHLKTVTLSGAQETVFAVSQRDGKPVWRTGGKEVSGEGIATLAAGLSGLTLTSCADYQPSEDAVRVCGFETPTLTLTVDYQTEQETDAVFTLTVGKKASGDRGYYVRVNDDTTIYCVTAESIAQLLTLGANGLTPAA